MEKKMVVGAIIMSVMILVAIPLGMNRSLDEVRYEAESSYYYDDTGFSVSSGFGNRANAARNLVTVAERYVNDNTELVGLISEVERLSDKVDMVYDDFTLKEEANNELGYAAKALADELNETELAEADKKYPYLLIAEMDSEQDKIEKSSYNDDAREFNERLSAIPGFLRLFIFVEPLESFN